TGCGCWSCASRSARLPAGSSRLPPLAREGTHPGDVAPQPLQLRAVAALLSGDLHAQRKMRLAQLAQLLVEPGRVLGSQFVRFHRAFLAAAQAPMWRLTNTVDRGSLEAASLNASRASSSLTPSIS